MPHYIEERNEREKMINLNATGENVGDMVSAIARCPPRTVDNALDPEQQQKAALRN